MEPLDFSIFPERPVKYATFWERFAALIIDAILLSIIEMLVHALLRGNFGVIMLRDIVLGWLYYAIQESGPNMATMGKRAMRIRVTDLNNNRISFGQATTRHFGKILSGIILMIGYFMVLWDERHQALHDKIAGTLVISDSSIIFPADRPL